MIPCVFRRKVRRSAPQLRLPARSQMKAATSQKRFAVTARTVSRNPTRHATLRLPRIRLRLTLMPRWLPMVLSGMLGGWLWWYSASLASKLEATRGSMFVRTKFLQGWARWWMSYSIVWKKYQSFGSGICFVDFFLWLLEDFGGDCWRIFGSLLKVV